MPKRLVGVLLLSSFLLVGGAVSATQDTACLPGDLARYLVIIQKERRWPSVVSAMKCAISLAPTSETAKLRVTRLDQALQQTQMLDPKWPATDEAYIAVGLAKALRALGITEGYGMIREYLATADWNTPRDQSFFAIVATALDEPHERARRAEILVEIYYLALRYMPASRGWDLVSACAYFHKDPRSADREESEYIQAVVSALSRLEKAKDSPEKTAATASCERTLLSQLLIERMRLTFLRSPLHQLSPNERGILDKFLDKVTPPPDPKVAKQLSEALFSVPWNVTSSTWKRSNPQGSCEIFRGDSSERRADDLWCAKCTVTAGRLLKGFYFFPNAQGTVCALQKAWFSYPTTSHGAVAATVDALSRQQGPGVPRSTVHGPGSGWWEEISAWNWKGREIYVFRAPGAGPGEDMLGVHIYAQERELILAVEQEKAAERSIEKEKEQADRAKEARLYREVGQSLLELVRRLEQSSYPELRAQVLLDLVPKIAMQGPQRAAQLYLADWLARELADPVKAQYVKDLEQKARALSAYGVGYEQSYDGILYNHILLKRIVDEGLTGYWRDEAFLEWLTIANTGSCDAPDEFKRVIAKGREFLKRNPKSHIRKSLLLALAQAYDTAWSLSRASPWLVQPENYRVNAEQRRNNAIAYYRQFLSEFPDSNETVLARLRLTRLRLGVDTNSRDFYYICH
jgi:hypothetical protein